MRRATLRTPRMRVGLSRMIRPRRHYDLSSDLRTLTFDGVRLGVRAAY
jgi:hypothetical protein